MVSGTLSLPLLGYFSPFPHGTGTLSVSLEYLALPDGPGGFIQDYTCPALLRIPLGCSMLRIKDFHLLWCNFPDASPHIQHTTAWSYNPRDALPQRGLGLFPVRSPLLGESLLFSFPVGTKMFQFPTLASRMAGYHSYRMMGCPIRKSADQRSCAPTRGLSQLVASFIA